MVFHTRVDVRSTRAKNASMAFFALSTPFPYYLVRTRDVFVFICVFLLFYFFSFCEGSRVGVGDMQYER